MASDTWKGPGKHYVVLLLDGDGFLFINSRVNPKLTVKERLLLQLEKYMNSLNGVDDRKDPRWRRWPEAAFRVRVYLSLRDLRSTIARSRRNLDLVDLDRLMETFRSPGMLWDIIDVGPGEDSADKRIKRDWDANFNEPKCIHLICGITHDHGYVDMAVKHNLGLEKILRNSKDSRKVTLLTCKATHHRYRGMPFAIVALPFLFNSQPLTAEPNYTDAFTKQYTGTYRGKSDVEMMISEELSRKELALSNRMRLTTLDATELARYDDLKEKVFFSLDSQTELRLVRRANIALHGEKVRLQEAQETTKAPQKSQAEELHQALKDNGVLRANLEKTQDMVKRLGDLRAKEKQQEQLKEKETFLLTSQAELQLMQRHIIRLNMALRSERVRLQEAQETTEALQKFQAEELQQVLKDNASLHANQGKNQNMIKTLQDFRAKEEQEDSKDATTDSRKASGKRIGINPSTKEAHAIFPQQPTGQERQAVTPKPGPHHFRSSNIEEDDNLTRADKWPGASAKTAYHIKFQTPSRPRQQLRSSPTTTTVAELKIIIQSTFGSWRQDMQHLQRCYYSSTLRPLCRGEIIQIRRRYIANQARKVVKARILNSTRTRLCSRLSAFGGKIFGCGWRQASDTNEG